MLETQPELDFYNAINGYFARRVSSRDVAEDLTQEVFLKIAKFNKEEEVRSVKSWVFTIAKNTLIDYYRKTKQHEAYDEQSYASVAAEEESSNAITECMLQMLSNLDREDENLLRKIDLEEVSQKEFSEQLNIDYTTLKSRVQRARKKLHRELIACCKFQSDRRGNVSFCEQK